MLNRTVGSKAPPCVEITRVVPGTTLNCAGSEAGTVQSGPGAEMVTVASAVSAWGGRLIVTSPSELETWPPFAALTSLLGALGAVTVSVAELLVAEPAELLTATVNITPESVTAVEVNV